MLLKIEPPIKRRVPLLGPNPDYSKVLYTDPPSHDFCQWLIMAELMRRHHKAPAPLKVRFLFQDGLLGKYDYGKFGIMDRRCYAGLNDMGYSNTMVSHVLRPAIKMIGGINEPDLHVPIEHAAVERYCEYDYHIWSLIDAARQGFEVPRWQVPTWAKKEVADFLQGEFPVVITLRETETQQLRNSNIDDWIRFARHISKTFPVIILRDTSMVNAALGELRTWPYASSNVFIRTALYQEAFCNLSVSGGPNSWMIYSSAPYLFFKQLVPTIPDWEHGQAKGWRVQAHMEVGDQFPWAGTNQRMTWKDDTFENILHEFEHFTADAISAAA